MSSRDNFKQAAKELFGRESTRRERTPLSGFVAEMDEEALVTEAQAYSAPEAEHQGGCGLRAGPG